MNIVPKELLKDDLSRLNLLSLPVPQGLQTIEITVHRNHAFEPVASVLPVFLACSGLTARFHYSDYDDSLSFINMSFTFRSDAHLIWLDAARYKQRDLSDWLEERLLALRAQDTAPVLVCCLGQNICLSKDTGCLVCDMQTMLGELGQAAEDRRLAPFSGTRLSNRACLECARWMGLRYLPSLFRPALKALALDCDNTLYDGVLAEDGTDGVTPYLAVQKYLQNLARQGFLLTLVSRNEEADVRRLFERRRDFPLHWEDFAATAINWQPKSDNIRFVADRLNIGLNAMVFVDDNWGELTQVGMTLPEVRLLAASSPEETLRGLRYCPLLWKPDVMMEDTLRNTDVQANQVRYRLQFACSSLEYRKQLDIHLTLTVNPVARIARVTELLNKTNQFIFTFLRPSQESVMAFMSGKEKVCVACNVRDKLSDSGLVAIVLGLRSTHEGSIGTMRVAELTVSCRALGRGIETGLIFAMLRHACATLDCDRVCLSWRTGPRNAPGIAWLREYWPGVIGDTEALADVSKLTGHLEGVCIDPADPGDIES
ncbi:MAG: HAD-IIIC family phosphatase [Desulfovibrionaceae bacterium]|nr:HAD-IIIC family phosphatase [Desulfovibrionaceae bacterium]